MRILCYPLRQRSHLSSLMTAFSTRMHSSRKYSHHFVVLNLCRRDLFQVYLVHGDTDARLAQHCRFADAGEIQFKHLSVGRGEGGAVCGCRVCVWVGLLELVCCFIFMRCDDLS